MYSDLESSTSLCHNKQMMCLSYHQILSSQSISSCPVFRHFYQVNFSRQNIVNGKDEVCLDIKFSGVHGDSYADENLEEVVVVEQYGILIG